MQHTDGTQVFTRARTTLGNDFQMQYLKTGQDRQRCREVCEGRGVLQLLQLVAQAPLVPVQDGIGLRMLCCGFKCGFGGAHTLRMALLPAGFIPINS